jgi:low temperature requirement protein LtrA
MTSPAQSVERDAVSPLELFFDLVFVFAVSQLSHHLLDHLTWRGAAETLVLPSGILWEHLDQDKIAQVPALAALAGGRRGTKVPS